MEKDDSVLYETAGSEFFLESGIMRSHSLGKARFRRMCTESEFPLFLCPYTRAS